MVMMMMTAAGGGGDCREFRHGNRRSSIRLTQHSPHQASATGKLRAQVT
jgi:hypothetical protein